MTRSQFYQVCSNVQTLRSILCFLFVFTKKNQKKNTTEILTLTLSINIIPVIHSCVRNF